MTTALTIRRCSPIAGCLLLATWWTGAIANVPDVDVFDTLLLQNVRNGFVNYDGLAADSRFGEFIGQIGSGSTDVLEGPDAGLAFYINAYNALAIQGILAGRSPERRSGRRKFFRNPSFRLLGEPISLEELEQERIVPRGDPRIHFAIVCASLSCPRLSSRAYQPDQINKQLHEAARRFINDPTRNRFDLQRRIAFLAPVFEQNEAAFERAGGSLQRYLARFVEDAEVEEALLAEEFELRYTEPDWSLNGYYSKAK